MPTYSFLDKQTGNEWSEFMGIQECEDYLKANPHIERLVNGAPMIVSSAMGGKTKPDDGFRDLLKDMKKKHSGGITKSTINTF